MRCVSSFISTVILSRWGTARMHILILPGALLGRRRPWTGPPVIITILLRLIQVIWIVSFSLTWPTTGARSRSGTSTISRPRSAATARLALVSVALFGIGTRSVPILGMGTLPRFGTGTVAGPGSGARTSSRPGTRAITSTRTTPAPPTRARPWPGATAANNKTQKAFKTSGELESKAKKPITALHYGGVYIKTITNLLFLPR